MTEVQTNFKEPKEAKDIPTKVRSAVTKRSGGDCEVQAEGCTGVASEMHHRKRRSQGGKHTADNLVGCCRHCHHDVIHANVQWAKDNGYIDGVRRGSSGGNDG